MKSVFRQLKVGQKVKDNWYGKGTVVKLLKTRVDIKINGKGLCRYDIEHVNAFITIEGKK
jgi:hypothetical protein